MLRYQLGWTNGGGVSLGGKGLRPSLCLLACESIGGDIEQALPIAVGDRAGPQLLAHPRRHRGRRRAAPSPPALWSVYGRDQAIAAGIALWTLAYQTLDRSRERGLPAEPVLEARRILNEACTRDDRGPAPRPELTSCAPTSACTSTSR